MGKSKYDLNLIQKDILCKAYTERVLGLGKEITSISALFDCINYYCTLANDWSLLNMLLNNKITCSKMEHIRHRNNITCEIQNAYLEYFKTHDSKFPTECLWFRIEGVVGEFTHDKIVARFSQNTHFNFSF